MNRILIPLMILALATAALADVYEAASLGDGSPERIADALCGPEDAFLCAPDGNRGRLCIGGSSGYDDPTYGYFCATEYGACVEFSLEGLPANLLVDAATLHLYALPGYESAPEIGAFAYAPAAEGALVARADMSAGTALSTTVPPLTYADFTMDVTAGVQAALSGGATEIGFALCGVVDLSGQDAAGCLLTGAASGDMGYSVPRLEVQHSGVVADEPAAWGQVKSLYR